MFRVRISIFLLLVVSNNVTVTEDTKTEDKDALRIVNGEPAEEGQFKYQVSLKQHHPAIPANEYMNICGGALIGASLILTAAHCFEKDAKKRNACEKCCKKPPKYNLKNYHAVAGSIENFQLFGAAGQWRDLKKVIAHEGYAFPEKDIAVAHTMKPFELNEKVKVIPFARDYIDYGSIKCAFAGFGRSSYATDVDEYPTTLLWANLPLISAKACSRLHQRNMFAFICTKYKKANPLEGDSGGPLVCKKTGDPNDEGQGVVVGIECGARDVLNFFTRVSRYSAFIAKSESCEALCPESLTILLSIIVFSVYRQALGKMQFVPLLFC